MNRTTLSRIIRRVEFSMLNNFQPSPQTVLINSIPKAGTHLMSSMLNEIPQLSISLDLTDLDKLMNDDARLRLFKSKTKESTQGIWLGHIPYTKSIDQLLLELNIPVIFIYRDPRDIVVSLLHYAIKNENHIERNVQLGSKEFKLLKGYAFENIGIHFVNSRYFKDAISMFWKSFKLKGPSIKMIYNFMRMGVVFMKNHSK
jgi:hypothetical protein